MELTRRFVFRATASALGGQIFVPKTIIVDMDGASAIGVSGGRSQATIQGRSFGDVIRFGSASTFAEALFDDEKRAREVVSHKRRQDELTSTTTASAELRGLAVGQDPLFTVERIRGTLVSRSPDGSGEPPIAPGRDTVIQGARIGGHGLAITLNLGLFQKHDTRSKLVAAADDAAFVRANSRCLSMMTPVEGQPPPGRPRLVNHRDAIYATLVRQIRWTGRPYPGAKIDDHTVIVPEFGRIFFGELFISRLERRLTMVRFDLGSPVRGYGNGVDVGSNGMWYPP